MIEADDELGRSVEQLAQARTLAQVTPVVRLVARQLTRADGVTFVLREGDKCYYADESAIRPLWKGKRFPAKSCISGWVMSHGEAVVVPDIYADPRIPHAAYRPTFVKSMAMVPVRHVDPIAAIGAYWADPHTATDAEIAILTILADASGLALGRS